MNMEQQHLSNTKSIYKNESIIYIDRTTEGRTQNTFVEQFNKEEKKSPSNHLYASKVLEVKAHAMFNYLNVMNLKSSHSSMKFIGSMGLDELIVVVHASLLESTS